VLFGCCLGGVGLKNFHRLAAAAQWGGVAADVLDNVAADGAFCVVEYFVHGDFSFLHYFLTYCYAGYSTRLTEF